MIQTLGNHGKKVRRIADGAIGVLGDTYPNLSFRIRWPIGENGYEERPYPREQAGLFEFVEEPAILPSYNVR